jgi:hypothetical protein
MLPNSTDSVGFVGLRSVEWTGPFAAYCFDPKSCHYYHYYSDYYYYSVGLGFELAAEIVDYSDSVELVGLEAMVYLVLIVLFVLPLD